MDKRKWKYGLTEMKNNCKEKQQQKPSSVSENKSFMLLNVVI